MEANNTKKAKTSFKYDRSNLEYSIRLNKKKKWWWLLLLLLIPLLFINLEKTLQIKVIDYYGAPVANAEVSLSYTSSYLYKDTQFFLNRRYREQTTTDASGICKFEKAGYSVYSFIFKMLSMAKVEISSECAEDVVKTPYYHFWYGTKTFAVQNKIIDFDIWVLDKDDRSPISKATIYYEYNSNGTTKKDSLKTNSAGIAQMINLSQCQIIDRLEGSAYGYKNDVLTNVSVTEALKNNEKRTFGGRRCVFPKSKVF